MHAEIMVKGIVQGVGFRPFIYRLALENNLNGYVRNRGDAGVEIVVEGIQSNVKRFIAELKCKKPSLAQIYDVSKKYTLNNGGFTKFSIVDSFRGGNLSGSIIPYDVSICEKCLHELRDSDNRRHDYFFITCTECGPRYTIIKRLPYDRLNTTMQDFPMCEECTKEYSDPLNRRFHAQTIACKKCGPKIFLTDNKGRQKDFSDPIEEAGGLIEDGYIVAVKGNGGFHLAASTTKSKPIVRLRNVKHRVQKPFAIMARDLKTVKSFVELNDIEAELLTSSTRPIILLKKNRNYYLSERISPGLHNIGVMLPYTGLHYKLFDRVKEPAFVMTSANPPSEPMVTNNQEALEKLESVVDFFLFHNRDIAQRCDDSVIRVHNQNKTIIRRSRGYAPSPIRLKDSTGYTVLGLGAEENVNVCILLGDKAFISQYIGDIGKLETLSFLEKTAKHIIRLTKGRINAVARDLHPKFLTTTLAQEFGKRLKCPVFPVQHHYAHLLSLMGEKGVDEILGIVCDGSGYGLDGNAWGGEIIHCTMEEFDRLGHLQEQPMIGGDLATRFPIRMVIGIIHKVVDIEEWVFTKASCFPYGEKEIEIILKQVTKGRLPKTSSCGRVLDSIAALLGLCYERTYAGEPAMKLEAAAINGEDVLKLKPKIKGRVIDTTYLVKKIFDNTKKYSISDLANSAEAYIAESLAELALFEACKISVNTIGFSGGVAYNEHIASIIRKAVERNGLEFIVHNQVPPGDGGISFGQAIAANSAL